MLASDEPSGAAKTAAFIFGGVIGLSTGGAVALLLTLLFPPMIIVSWLIPLAAWRMGYNVCLGRNPEA